ncbi:hypothetical protein AB7M16_003696 [Bradyrhizobium sp. USDA 372]
MRRVWALPTPVVRPAAAECCRAPAWPLARAWRPGPVIPEGVAARQDVRRAEVRRGDQPAVRRACCPEPALRVSQSEPALPPARARRGVPWAQLSEQAVLPSAQARASAGPAEPLPEAAEGAGSGEPQAAAWSGPAAAAPPREAAGQPGVRQAAAPAVWELGARQGAAEAAVSGRAAAAPRPEAAKAASEQQAAAGAAEVPDGPQGEAEAVAALPGAAGQLPAGALQAGAAVLPRAAEPRGARVLQAARLRAVPSAAASVFRQGPCLAAGPARPRAARRLAHAMRCWPIASRSEPSSQAARNEGWSWW